MYNYEVNQLSSELEIKRKDLTLSAGNFKSTRIVLEFNLGHNISGILNQYKVLRDEFLYKHSVACEKGQKRSYGPTVAHVRTIN